MEIRSINNQSFQGVNIAKAKVYAQGLSEQYNLFSLSSADDEFIKTFIQKMDFKKVYPKLSCTQYSVWEDVCQKALTYTDDTNIVFMADRYGIPAGVLNFSKGNSKYILNYIAAIPSKFGKPLLAGKTLIMHLFKNFLDSRAKSIELFALKISAFNPIGKYKQMGFSSFAGGTYIQPMRASKKSVKSALKLYSDKISVTYTNNKNELNMFEIIDI